MGYKQITVRANTEIHDYFEKTYDKQLFPVKAEFVKTLLDVYTNPDNAVKSIIEKNNVLSQQVGDLQSENATLRSENSVLIPEIKQLKDKIPELQEQLTAQSENPELQQINQDLTTENETLKARILELENNPQTEFKEIALQPNQEIITFSDRLKHFINILLEMESKRLNRKITAGEMLSRLFWEQLTEGKGYYLPYTWTNSEIDRICKLIDKKKQVADEQTTDQDGV